MKTKIGSLLALAFIGLGSPALQAGDVILGGVTFDDSSIEVAANWLDPMPVGTTLTYEGTGTNAGRTRTISFSQGGEVGGVSTLKRHLIEKGGDSLAGTAAETTEDTWIAFDAEDNARVLKIEKAGAVVFEATADVVPPVYLPVNLVEGASWEIAGTTVTIEWVARSSSGYNLKITFVDAAGASRSDTFNAGKGLVKTEFGEASGWNLKSDQ